MSKKVFSFLLVILSIYSCTKSQQAADLGIENISIINLKTGEIKSSQSIYINGDSIVSITDTNSDSKFSAAETVDGTNQFLIPGFWDNHIHLRGGDSLIEENKHLLELYLANGITTVRDAGGDLTPSVHKWQDEIANGDLAGPTIYTSGPKIDGPEAQWAGSLEVSNLDDITRALDSLQELNVDFVKLYDSTISGENYLKTIEETEKRNMITSGHMPYTVNLDEAIDAGIDGVEHLYYILKGTSSDEQRITDAVKSGSLTFWSSLDEVMKSYDAETAQNRFNRLKENNVFVIPTLHIGHTLSYLDENDHATDEYLDYIGKGIIKTYSGRLKSATGASSEFKVMRKNLDSAFVQLAGTLNSSGVRLLAGSDAGAFNSYIYPGQSLHYELEALVDAGLSPLEALQASSQNGATFLKKTIPSIENGAKADLVILQNNPLQDITHSKSINYVIKNGKTHTKKELQNLLKSN